MKPNNTIAEGLIQFCKKVGLSEDNWVVLNGRKEVDISLTYRLSGLPAHAKLVLKKSEVPLQLQDVNIALQFSNNRFINKFPSSTTLWDILKYWEKEKGINLTTDGEILPDSKDKTKVYMQPVITYTTKEIGTNAELRATTLAKLGLISGNGLLRLLHKYTTMPLDEFLKRDGQSVATEKINEEKENQILLEKRLQESKERQEQAIIEREKIEAIRKAAEEEQQRMAERVKQYIKEDELEKKKMEEQHIQLLAERKKQEEIDRLEVARLTKERTDRLLQESTDRFLQEEDTNRLLQEGKNRLLQEDTVVNKEKLVKEENKRKLPENTNNIPKKEPEIPEEPIDRNTQVFAPSTTPFDPHTINIPDDFYNITSADLKQNAEILKKRKKTEMEEKSVLKTKEMRERDREKKWSKYTKCYIRIRFPDRTELQGIFRPTEKPKALYSFINDSLREENRSVPFYVYTIPPKVIIKIDELKNFRDIGFLPAALVYFGLEEGVQMQTPFITETLIQAIKEKLPPPEIYIPTKEQTILTGIIPIEIPEPKKPKPLPLEETNSEEEEKGKKAPSWFQKGKK